MYNVAVVGCGAIGHRLADAFEANAGTTLQLVDEFVAALDGNGGDLVSFADANRVQHVVDAVFASEGGRLVVGVSAVSAVCRIPST